MKVALVHDQLQEFGGAERVLVSLKNIFPEAPLYTSFYSSKKLGIHADIFKNWRIITSWANKVPFLKNLYSPLRFITPLLWEPFTFSEYDLVISSSGSYMSKGIVTRPETLHICYLHHPPRYLYGYETAIEWQRYWLVKMYGNVINHDLRMWDYLSSERVDYFIANSEETKKRITKFYRRDSEVIYPPVHISQKSQVQSQPRSPRGPAYGVNPAIGVNGMPSAAFNRGQKSTYIQDPYKTEQIQNSNNQNRGQTKIIDQKFYITVSRLARAKHIEILIHAANQHKLHLKIVGTGRDETYLRSLAGESVEFLNNISDQHMSLLYKKAYAFLFASVDEEFGIAPVEAMGYGVPVLAYKSGGLCETVSDGINGFLYDELEPESLIEKIKILESLSPEKYKEMRINVRKKAENFSEEKFKKRILAFINVHRNF